MIRLTVKTLSVACLLGLVSCQEESRQQAVTPPTAADEGVLLRIGSVTVSGEDLVYHLKEKHSGRTDDAARQAALAELTDRARLVQAALDAGVDDDPEARAEIARILVSRLKEIRLDPQLRAIASTEIAESRLRELYESRKDDFQSAEKRQVAVLWLDPGANPERAAQYEAKLGQARDWYLANSDLAARPDQGFSVLSVDYSEHAASRFKNGLLGWLERDGGADPIGKAAAEIVFSLGKPGDVSGVISRPEGMFLVRCMAIQTAFVRPFESVAGELEQAERQRLMRSARAEFESSINSVSQVSNTIR